MSSKLLVIIATGENEKALTGLMYANRTLAEGWMDKVKVIFFGPSERLLVEDELIAKTAKEIGALEKPMLASLFPIVMASLKKLRNLD